MAEKLTAENSQFLNVRVPKPLHRAVKRYKHRNELDTDAEAVRRLLLAGLVAEGFPTEVPPDA